MSIPAVQIHLLTVDYDTRTVITRWCVADYFDTTYDPTDGEGPQDWITTVGDQKVRVLLDGVPGSWYSLEDGVKEMVQAADAILLINRPEDPQLSDSMVNLRHGPFQEQFKAQGKQPLEVILDLWWEEMPADGRATKESEGLARRIDGAEIHVCCAKTGAGIQSVVRDVVAKVLDDRVQDGLHQGGSARDRAQSRFDETRHEAHSRTTQRPGGWKKILDKFR